MRGEHLVTTSTVKVAVGSSPHARGARVLGRHERLQLGIIPACAGSTGTTLNDMVDTLGSSPHARGAPVRLPCEHNGWGIIPACAGSTSR